MGLWGYIYPFLVAGETPSALLRLPVWQLSAQLSEGTRCLSAEDSFGMGITATREDTVCQLAVQAIRSGE